ncbi:MAG: glycosyltransferase family 2 protein [Balneolaceae bacterium]|nr:glycosyltransferase family 2 protein [Balneolaceae bacterium]
MSSDLAIVIPVYKKEFLAEALESIKRQSNQNFTAYIGDDASPYQLKALIDQLKLPDNFKYHRFDENLGQHSLVKQWQRCIERTQGEKWIWLFSDDDIAEEHCVENFYSANYENPGYDVYRFNTSKIDEDGNIIRENIFPQTVSSSDFLNIKLNYKQESYVVESIFGREAYDRVGGFPDLPLAWATDDMFWAKISANTGIFTIDGARVSWRYSGSNISSRRESRTGKIKLKASRTFIRWIYSEDELLSKLEPPDLPIKWYIRQLKNLRRNLNYFEQILAVARISDLSIKSWFYFAQLVKNESKIVEWLKRF